MEPSSDDMQLGQTVGSVGFAKGLHVGPQCSEAYRSAHGIVGKIQSSSRKVVPI
jgi:isocitrate dehydrogenase